MKTIKEVINLHPTDNGGESTLATIKFEDRILSLTLECPCYGNHYSSITVNFNSPEDMMTLARKLNSVASSADIELFKYEK
jgi:hypothetical protein